MADPERDIIYSGVLFRLEHQPLAGHTNPHEFVRRIGAVTVLPIITTGTETTVLAIQNRRDYYGVSTGLPSGNADDGFEHPENPYKTAVRELQEETGHVPQQGLAGVEVFRMRNVSSTIDYPRYFAVARNVLHIGGELNDEHEQITLTPLSLEEYMAPVFALSRGDLYPEVNLAFAKAALEHGQEVVIDWIRDGSNAPDIHSSFEPWIMFFPLSSQEPA